MALIKQTDLEARIGRTLTDEEASAFPVINSALQTIVERMIGSSVEAVQATTRYYDGGVQNLAIDPATNITAVNLVDNDHVSTYTYDTSDYTVEPRNGTMKTMLRLRWPSFTSGFNYIAVTGKFSIYEDEGVRNVVKNALLDALASELGNTDNILKESIEGYSVEYASAQTKNSLSSIKYLFPGV